MDLDLIFTILIGFLAAIFCYFIAKFKFSAQKLSSEVDFLRDEKLELSKKADFLQDQNLILQKENILLKQQESSLRQEKEDWSADKERMLFELSEKLLRKNQEQQHLMSQSSQENIRKITEDLFKSFENVTNKVSSLNDEVKESSKITNLTKQALLSPGSAGRTAEITLENILKNSGLREKSNFKEAGDYILQSHFSSFSAQNNNEGNRPDALLFFPGDQIAIIDSKSSPHFLELETAIQEGDIGREKVILDKIKESFRRHLDSLKKKEYAKSLFEDLLHKNPKDHKIMIIMFLQTEKMLDIVRKVDANFEQKALENGVIVASPIGLINFLSQARIVIDRSKQQKNIEDIKIAVGRLLDNISVVFRESKDLGKSLNRSLNLYNKMVKTMNSGVYSATQNIKEFGITGKKSDSITLLEDYKTKDE